MPRISRRGSEDRSLTAGGLARLLGRLDRDEAAHEYEHLRHALVRFFEWRGASPANECADITIDRLARRLEEDTTIEDVRLYAHGIARLVLLERRRRPPSTSVDDIRPLAAYDWPPAESDSLRECFERCLGGLAQDSRSLLLEYYQGERAVKIANRRRIASTLGVSENALRSRVQRLRERLEECVSGRLSRRP